MDHHCWLIQSTIKNVMCAQLFVFTAIVIVHYIECFPSFISQMMPMLIIVKYIRMKLSLDQCANFVVVGVFRIISNGVAMWTCVFMLTKNMGSANDDGQWIRSYLHDVRLCVRDCEGSFQVRRQSDLPICGNIHIFVLNNHRVLMVLVLYV